jgi:hypothetical protein
MVLKIVCTFSLNVIFYNENRAILFDKLENYTVTIELILAGDENLPPNQNIEISRVIEGKKDFRVISNRQLGIR